MDNPQITEAAVALQFNLFSNKNENFSSLIFGGQDLFKIYSNNSYTCQVEMMGCAQIQPLMYFQLNNIPMFRGSYLIQKVTHHIEPGNMETTIVGTRMSKYSNRKFELIDSLTISVGQGLVGYLLARMYRNGSSIEEIVDSSYSVKKQIAMYISN
jgi:hypothetical protein